MAHTRSDNFHPILSINFRKNRPDRNVIPEPVPIAMKGSFLIALTINTDITPSRIWRNAMANSNFSFGISTLLIPKLFQVVDAMIPQMTKRINPKPRNRMMAGCRAKWLIFLTFSVQTK
jgi:hypothetical protein